MTEPPVVDHQVPDPGGSPNSDRPAGDLDVVAVGSALVDVLAHASDDDLRHLSLVKGSMALVDLERAAAIYGSMAPATEISGGSAANTAVGVAALGGRAGYIGKLADDELGEVFHHDIAAAGVVLGRGRRAPAGSPSGAPGSEASGSATSGSDTATGRCLVLVTPDGERTMATHLGVASTLDPGDLDEELVSRASILYLEGYLWDLGPAKEAMRRAIHVAHAADALVALSVSDPFCVERHRTQFLELIRDDLDVLFANEEEAVSLFGARSFPAAVDAAAETGLLVALTRGAAGSVVVSPSGPRQVAAEPVDAVVDTTGAGDLYAAGFLRGLTLGLDPTSCARLGGLSAAECVAHLGARPQHDLAVLAAAAGLA